MRSLALTLVAACAASACARAERLPHGSRSSDCASCHPAQYEEWRGSAHAQSGQSPVFTAMLPEVERAWGVAARDACVDCHSPGHGGDEGIGCVSCHAAIGNEREQDGRLIVDTSVPIAGPFDDAQPTDAHATRSGELLASPSLCGTCHEVRAPGLFDEPTLGEYRETGLEGIGTTCATCHLPEVEPAPIATGSSVVRERRSHRFVGFDPPVSATPAEAEEAAERTRALLADALLLLVRESEDGTGVEVVLENAGAGHDVPTGISFMRDIWVDIEITSDEGRVELMQRILELGDLPTRDGEPVPLPTDGDAIEHRRLALGESVSMVVDAPATARRVEATLRARAIRPDALEALGLDEREAPTHTVATETWPGD